MSRDANCNSAVNGSASWEACDPKRQPHGGSCPSIGVTPSSALVSGLLAFHHADPAESTLYAATHTANCCYAVTCHPSEVLLAIANPKEVVRASESIGV